MQVDDNYIFTTEPNTLYLLPNGDEVYGGDQNVVVVQDIHNVGWDVKYHNPKTKEWCRLYGETEKDWLFSNSNISRDVSEKDFTKICYDSDDGWIEFDILSWLHKNISTSLTVDEDFYYDHVVKFGETEYNLNRSLEDYGTVKSYKEFSVICKLRNDVHVITEDLKRYFSKKKLPVAVNEVYNSIKDGSMSLQDFENWVRG